MYFSFLEPPEMPTKALLVMELGNIIHEYVQKLYPKNQVEVKLEIKQDNFVVKMSIDILEPYRVMELKTVSFIPKEPYEEHSWQVQLYMGASKRDHSFIIYIDKTTFQMKEYMVKFDEVLYRSILTRFETLHQHIIKKVVPKREVKMFHSHPRCQNEHSKINTR